ncbi:hypothetical protein [Streptomyces sp. NPDC048142]|uniref:hypothetical protein n=1 Tax=Streptomyces sp. NPDC048142 TaxID=3365501 RepID=UPI00371B0640
MNFTDAHDPTDVIAVRHDEDSELELTIVYGDGSSVRTVFLAGETLAAFSKFVADTAEAINGTAEDTPVSEPLPPEVEPEDKPTTDAEFLAARADAWHAARGLLINSGFGFDTAAEDVVELAKFLAGDDIA